MKNICIYSYNISGLLSSNKELSTGGAELQLLTLAKLLKKKGYKITFLVGDLQINRMDSKNGFLFIKCYAKRLNNPIQKLFFLFNAIRKTKADIFIERGSSEMTFFLSLYAKFFKKKFIFCGASDINFATDEVDPNFSSRSFQRMFHVGLKTAGDIIVQKESQRYLVQKNFKRDAIVIKNFPTIVDVAEKNVKEWDVIWVNNIIPYKKPELVFTLARKLPLVKFLMIGGSRDAVYYEEIKKKALEYTNITFAGFIPANEVANYILRSKIMLNTTIVKGKYEEGFPNSLLQAWQLGIPAVSLISNPDNILEKYSIGFCSLTENKMVDDIMSLLGNEKLYRHMSGAAKEYVLLHHNTRTILQQYLDVIES